MRSIPTLVVCFLFPFLPLAAQNESANRSFEKTLPAGRGTKLEIVNRYGDIYITKWDRESALIKAEIEAFAPDREKLDKLISGIDVSITEKGSLIRAETVFEREATVLIETFKSFTEKIIDYGSKVKISYYITVPEYIDIDIRNQFGDITVDDNSGTLSIDLSNGNFRANSLNRIADLKLNLGDAEIGSLKSARIITSFSGIKVNSCDELELKSTSTKFDLGKAGMVELESRRDKFFIDDISTLKGVSWFSEYSIARLSKEADLDLKSGNINIKRVSGSFKSIVLKSAYTDIEADFDPSASWDFEIRHVNSSVVLPGRNTRSREELVNEKRKEYLITGKKGSGDSRGRLMIEANRGNIRLN